MNVLSRFFGRQRQEAPGPASEHDAATPFIGPGAPFELMPELHLNRSGMTEPAEQYYDEGSALLAKEHPQEAAQKFQKALQLEPDHLRARLQLANAYIYMNDNAAAACECNAVLQAEPGQPNAHYGLAVVHWREKRVDSAIREYQLAIRSKPDFCNAHCYLGQAYRAQENWNAAERELEQALSLQPDHTGALDEMCRVYSGQARFQKLADTARKLLRLQPNHRYAHYSLGCALHELGNREEGVRQLHIAADAGSAAARDALRQLGLA